MPNRCYFFFILPTPTFFPHFLLIFFKNIIYPKSSQSLCEECQFSSIKNCHKSGRNLDFSEKFNFQWNQLDATVFFLSFSLAWPKTKAESAVEGRQNQDKVRHVWKIRVISLLIRINTDVTTSNLKILYKKRLNKVDL